MKKLIILITALAFWGCEKDSTGSDDGNGIVTIEITEDSYLPGSHSVWFSPSTGEITGTLQSETPPEEKYIYWIEPDDPEFRTWQYYESQDIYGIKFVGVGTNYFDETTNSESGGFIIDLFDTGTFEPVPEANSVFFIRAVDVDCIIQIIDWQPSYLEFKWKKL